MTQVDIANNQKTERGERSLFMARPDDIASGGTAAFGVSSAAGAAVAKLAPLSGAFMLLAIFGKGVIANWREPNC